MSKKDGRLQASYYIFLIFSGDCADGEDPNGYCLEEYQGYCFVKSPYRRYFLENCKNMCYTCEADESLLDIYLGDDMELRVGFLEFAYGAAWTDINNLSEQLIHVGCKMGLITDCEEGPDGTMTMTGC